MVKKPALGANKNEVIAYLREGIARLQSEKDELKRDADHSRQEAESNQRPKFRRAVLADAEVAMSDLSYKALDLADFRLNEKNRKRVESLLRRLYWIEKKEEESDHPSVWAGDEILATKWAIAMILQVVGKKSPVEAKW